MTAILSVAVLAISVFLPGQSFGLRAAGFRECYLRLQQIYGSTETAEVKLKAYAEALPLYENHTQVDYDRVLFRSWLYQKPLFDKKGKIIVARAIIIKGFARIAFGWIFLLAISLIPIVFGFVLTTPKSG